ncbi:hypothetical protein T03_16442 [Trichinella britovi]|uniref:Uncharacterized protein n=1 Tax=Trichinella britovi TaxID=45882 RepID=A0A0V1ATD1_TRIBR|nr:hypothetical protein T03_16442 [Trichinella britovi]
MFALDLYVQWKEALRTGGWLTVGPVPRFQNLGTRGMVPLGLNSIPIRAHCSFIGRCPRYFIIGR